MTDFNQTDKFDDLEQQLRREAASDRPEFSEALHNQIISAISTDAPRSPRAAKRSTNRRWPLTAAAAAVLLVVGLATWQFLADNRQQQASLKPDTPIQDSQIIAIEAVSRANGAEMGLLVDDALSQSQWAYLDHDARVAADLLINQFPFELAMSDQP